MGAWIETTFKPAIVAAKGQSHLSWVRGLKLAKLGLPSYRATVAPLMGAWIETNLRMVAWAVITVAPLMGAWIETEFYPGRFRHCSGRTSHGCVD